MAGWSAELGEPAALLAALLDATVAAVAIKDPDGRYLLANDAWAALNGVARDAVLGRTDEEAFPGGAPLRLCGPEDDEGRESLQQVVVDGEERIFSSRWYPLRRPDGELIARACSSVDVTLEKRDVALREAANAVLEQIATGAPLESALDTIALLVEEQTPGMVASILLLDDEGLRISHAAGPHLPQRYRDAIDGEAIGPAAGSCGTAAYRREQVIVADVLESPLWDRWRDAAVASGFRACWSTPIFATDGRVLGTFAMYYAEPRSPEEGELRVTELATHLAGIAIERDRAEKALREREHQLRQAQKMEAVGRLAGGIAHDFNNLLTAIGGYTELLLDRLPPEQRDDAEQIRHATERATALTKQLLAFTRSQIVQRETLDLNEVVRDTDRLLRRLIGAGVEVVSVLGPGPALVEADRSQLEQVIVNLALNARDAMPSGGKLVITTTTLDDWVELRVEDTGIGMHDDVLQHVFEPFFTTKEPARGTGLGLATVLGIVEQGGGRIDVASVPGEGSTFRILLPAAPGGASAEVEDPSAAPAVLTGTETVLLVEDEDIIRSLVARTLREHGYEVIETRYASEALVCWEERRDDIRLVLSDIVMPGMSGVELAARLDAEQPELRIVLMSGFADPGAGDHVEAPRTAAFLEKPFTPRELLRCVRATLG